MSAFDYVYFHKTIQDTNQQRTIHIHSWFLDNYQLQDTTINSTNGMSCFYKNSIFLLKDSKDETNTLGFVQSDLSMIHNVITTPINSNYIGGSQKSSTDVLSKLVDISIINKIFQKHISLHEITICVIIDKNLAHINIIYDNEYIYEQVPNTLELLS